MFSDFEAEIRPSDDRKTPTHQQSILGTSCGTFLDYCLRWRPVCFHDFANNEANTKGTVLAAYCSLTHNNKAKTARCRPLYFGKHSRRLLAIHDDKARPPTAGGRPGRTYGGRPGRTYGGRPGRTYGGARGVLWWDARGVPMVGRPGRTYGGTPRAYLW